MKYCSFKVQKCLIFKVSNLKKKNFNDLALWYFTCTVLNLRKNERVYLHGTFSNVEISQKNVILGPIFHGLCLIGYKSVNHRQILK